MTLDRVLVMLYLLPHHQPAPDPPPAAGRGRAEAVSTYRELSRDWRTDPKRQPCPAGRLRVLTRDDFTDRIEELRGRLDGGESADAGLDPAELRS
jgi:hypothetical protein